MANEGKGALTTVINAAAVGDAYGDIAGSSAVIAVAGADAIAVYFSTTKGTASGVTVEIAVSSDNGTSYTVIYEKNRTETTYDGRQLIKLTDFNTHVRIRHKANADATTASVTTKVRRSGVKVPF